jgi:hypothetical protein
LGIVGIADEIILDHYTPKNDTLFMEPPFYVLIDFDSFVNDHK